MLKEGNSGNIIGIFSPRAVGLLFREPGGSSGCNLFATRLLCVTWFGVIPALLMGDAELVDQIKSGIRPT